jgi:ankyrin repeat protein
MPRISPGIFVLTLIAAGFIPTIGYEISPPAIAAVKSPIDEFIDAIRNDDVKRVQQLLDEDPSLATAEVRSDGSTPLHYVRSAKVAGLLLDQGANLFALDRRYRATPLRWAAERFHNPHLSNLDLIHYLQSKGASEPDIFFAVAIGDVDRVKLLLSQDKKLAVTPGDGDDILADGGAPLHLAAYNGQLAVAKMLVENGASVNDRGGWHDTEPLEKASWTGRADVVTFLLDHGAKIDGVDPDYSNSPLYNAATAGRAGVVMILLDRGAKVRPNLVHEVEVALKEPGSDPELKADYQRIIDRLKR